MTTTAAIRRGWGLRHAKAPVGKALIRPSNIPAAIDLFKACSGIACDVGAIIQVGRGNSRGNSDTLKRLAICPSLDKHRPAGRSAST